MLPFIDDNVSTHSGPNRPKIVDGYPKLAEHMGSTPEVSIFRRFETLNRQNLLYLQAELTALEKELRNLEAESATCDAADPRSQYSRDWEWMNITDEKSNMNPQWQLFLRIRAILKEYNETLLQQAAISSFPKIEAYNLDYLQKWLSHPSCGNFPLIGSDHTVWKDTPPRDLLALSICPSSDPFTRWAINSFMPGYHRFIGHHFRKPHPGSQSEYIEYNSRKIARAASLISTILAAVMLIAPVVILYEISSMRARLGIIAGFTVVFSLCMAGLTNAKRGDIFAATAAFAAVQVVFISSNISSG
ncbi:hypothetical protein OIDMADRAFT_139048 [Oidiodendron maius Zn]|uniref:DUF6594 domain-containing protein n=1 Tax=Oidiodendron maius (strain Zn) TaxID=913774 RepID=A0A0C3C1R3_OIDMZ|nr:hypothetical protein OIDMADRAFT_139048 [Oidiodendron maius Zn]